MPPCLGAALLCIGVLSSAGCAIPNVDIEAEDNSVFFSGGRVSWSPSAPPRGAGQEEAAPPRESTISFDLDVTYGDGVGEQTLKPDQILVIDGVVFRGPEDLVVGFDLLRISLDARLAFPVRPGFSAEVFAGLERSSLDLSVRSGSLPPFQTGGVEVTAIGPVAGGALVWRPAESLRLSAEGRLSVGFSSQVDVVQLKTIELGISAFPFGPIGFFAGWRTTSYDADGDLLESGLDLTLSGPVFSVWFRI